MDIGSVHIGLCCQWLRLFSQFRSLPDIDQTSALPYIIKFGRSDGLADCGGHLASCVISLGKEPALVRRHMLGPMCWDSCTLRLHSTDGDRVRYLVVHKAFAQTLLYVVFGSMVELVKDSQGVGGGVCDSGRTVTGVDRCCAGLVRCIMEEGWASAHGFSSMMRSDSR